MNANYLMLKKNHLFYKVFKIDLFKLYCFTIYFSFSFCSDVNLEATVVKTAKIRGLKQWFTPCFLLIGKNFFQNNN